MRRSTRLACAAGLALLLAAVSATAQRVSDVRGTRHNLSTSGPGPTRAAAGGTSEVCVFCHTPHGASSQDAGGVGVRAPLWNRRIPAGATYTPYTSSSLDAQYIAEGLNNTPGGSSKLCLSCHDGTLAIGNVNVLNGNTDVTIPMLNTGPGGVMPAGEGAASGFTRFLGTDLRNDHPISVTFDRALADRDGELRAVDAAQRWPAPDGTVLGVRAPGYKPRLPLEPTGTSGQGQVQCATCHDPHIRETNAAVGNQKFLRMNRFQEAPPSASFAIDTDTICLSCHDKNGAFGVWAYSAHAHPDVANETYKDVPAQLREFPVGLPVWKAACLNCHDTHTVQGARRLTREGTDAPVAPLTPFAAKQGGNPALEATCYQCHASAGRSVVNVAANGVVPNLETEFALPIRMPITTAEQGGATEEVHDPSSNFNDGNVDCSNATNRCGADGMEPASRLGQRHAECTDCHNPHRVIRNRVFNANPAVPDASGSHRNDAAAGYVPSNLASGVLRGAWGVEPNYGSPSFQQVPTSFTVKRGDPGSDVGTDAARPYVTREYQICLKCHSNYAYGSTPPSLGRLGGTQIGSNGLTRYTNQAQEFQAPVAHAGGGIGDPRSLGANGGAGSNYSADNHRSWHPVLAPTGRDIGRRGITQAKMPWRLPFGNAGAVGTQTMYCSDCHGSSATTGTLAPNSGVNGPHGSTNPFLLKQPWNANDPSLCFLCHEREVYSPTGDSRKSGFYTGFCCRGGRDDGNDQLHWYHWNKILDSDPGRTLKCNWCHAAVPHGWKNKALLVNLNDVGEEGGQPGGNREWRMNANGQTFTQEPYYLNAKLKVRTFAVSGNWTDANCGSNNSALQFGTNANNAANGRDWMRDVCSNPP